MSRAKLHGELLTILHERGWAIVRLNGPHTILRFTNGAILTLAHTMRDTGRTKQNYLSLIKRLEAK